MENTPDFEFKLVSDIDLRRNCIISIIKIDCEMLILHSLC